MDVEALELMLLKAGRMCRPHDRLRLVVTRREAQELMIHNVDKNGIWRNMYAGHLLQIIDDEDVDARLCEYGGMKSKD